MDTNILLTILGVVLVISAIVGLITVLIFSQWQKDRQARIDQVSQTQAQMETTSRSGRIDLGEPVAVDFSNYYEVKPQRTASPENGLASEICPLCRMVISPAELYVCSGCQTSFHKAHYDEFYAQHSYCPNCQGRSRS